MDFKNILYLVFAVALLVTAVASENDIEKVENSTESPIADMAIIDAEMKTSTEKPPIAFIGESSKNKTDEQAVQHHTIGDYVIQPLIAFKPRNPATESPAGRQASDATSTSTTPSPWQLFGFNAGQGLGSSVSSLAGSVTGWLNDRIQLPGLVDTPVRESTSTSSSTTSTTTPRPDVVVRVQNRATTRRPIISINNKNRPQRFNENNNFNSEEDDDDYAEDDDDHFQNNRFSNDSEEDDDDREPEDDHDDYEDEGNRRKQHDDNEDDHRYDYEDDQSAEEGSDEGDNDDDEVEDDDDDEVEQRPNSKRRRPAQSNRRGGQSDRRNSNSQRQESTTSSKRRRPQKTEEYDSAEEDDDNDQFYYGTKPSTKRSQNQPNFIQRGQQNFLKQIRQFTRGQTPGEIGAAMRKSEKGTNNRRTQATLMVNRNGRPIYVAPELLNADRPLANPQYQYYTQSNTNKRPKPGNYPQPPLTVPLKRKGRPTQYITIPWAQLGISPPDQIVSIAEGIQSQPLILNIPQGAINAMQTPTRKRKRPVMSADNVPLLAEASIMDIFKPPRIPPSRTSTSKPGNRQGGSNAGNLSKAKPTSAKTSPALLPQRIRPATIVEKAPVSDTSDKSSENHEILNESVVSQKNSALRSSESDYIIVGDDNEPGLTRQVPPVLGDARYVDVADVEPYYEFLYNRRFAVGGRALEQPESASTVTTKAEAGELIPVKVIADGEIPEEEKPILEHIQEAEHTQKQMETEGQQGNREPEQMIQQNPKFTEMKDTLPAAKPTVGEPQQLEQIMKAEAEAAVPPTA